MTGPHAQEAFMSGTPTPEVFDVRSSCKDILDVMTGPPCKDVLDVMTGPPCKDIFDVRSLRQIHL
jgi:hypothetical protein